MTEEPNTRHSASYFYFLLLSVVLLAIGYFFVTVYQSFNTTTDQDIITELTEQASQNISFDSRSDGLSIEGLPIESSDDPYFGSIDATVRIVEFSDFECPFCRQSHDIVKQLEQRYGDQIFFQYRDFPVVISHINAVDAAIAAECAHKEGNDAFWAYHDRLFQFQDDLSEELYISIAERNGLNVRDFTTCFSARATEPEVTNDYNEGLDAGVPGTPTFFINGIRVPGVISSGIFFEVIDRLLLLEEE